jgi:N-acetylneuraminic acid mutarotase
MNISWIKLNPIGDEKLTARDGCCSVVLNQQFFLFGGFEDNENANEDEPPMKTTNELWCYDMEKAAWFKIESRGNVNLELSVNLDGIVLKTIFFFLLDSIKKIRMWNVDI